MKLGLKTLVGGAALALSIASGAFTALEAHAAYVVCREDPVVTLSNGITSTVYADVQDTLTDIQHVTFQLHGPSNTTVTSVQYDAYGAVESFTYTADQKPNTFKLSTTVTTFSGKVKFMTYVTTAGPGKSCSTSQHAGNASGKPVTFSYTC